MRILSIAFFALCSGACAADDSTIVLDPFTDNTAQSSEYRQPEWHFELTFFVASAGAYWIEHKRWPQTLAEARDGFALWLTSLGDGEKIEIEKGKFDFAEVLEITEVIPMREGVAYRMVFRKHGYEVPGLLDLSEADTVDAVAKAARYSESFARIVYAVPF